MKNQLAQLILDFERRRDRAIDAFVDEYGFDDARYEEHQAKRNIAVKIIDKSTRKIRNQIFSWARKVEEEKNWERFEASIPIRITHRYLKNPDKDSYFIKPAGVVPFDQVWIAIDVLMRHPYFRTRPEEKIPLPAEIGPILNEFFGLIPIPQEEGLGRDCHCEFDLYTQNEHRKRGWISKRRLNRIVRSYASRDPHMRLGEQPS